MKWRLPLMFLTVLFAKSIVLGSATDVWITQSGAGTKTGASLANAAPVSFLSNSANCGTASTQVGPGTTVHLSGTFTFPLMKSGTPAIEFDSMRCSGSAGSPIWLKTEPGFVCQSPAFSWGGNGTGGCIQVNSSSGFTPQYITIGGATPCGTTTGGVDSPNPCDGVIQNTANGTAFSNHQQTDGITMNGCANCEVKNVAIINMYVRTPNFTLTSVSCTSGSCTASGRNTVGAGAGFNIVGGTGTCSFSPTAKPFTVTNGGTTFSFTDGSVTCSQTGGTFVDESTLGYNFFYGAIQIAQGYGGAYATNAAIHDSIFHDSGWLLQPQGDNVSIYNNQLYNMDHGIGYGPYKQNQPGPSIHDNHFHDMMVWDDSIAQNDNHHDGIHLQIDTVNNPQNSFENVYIYNNTFDGNVGVPNAWTFLRASTTNEYVFNNVFGCSPSANFFPTGFGDNGGWPGPSFTTNPSFINNTITCTGAYIGGQAFQLASTVTGLTDTNNIFQGQQLEWSTPGVLSTLFAPNGILTNIYENNAADCGNCTGVWIWNFNGSGYTNTLGTWQAALPGGSGQDAGAAVYTTSALLLSQTGLPQASSPVFGSGTNLTSLCVGNLEPLCSDKAGNQRPTNGAWTIGAYQLAGPNPPTKLTATVN